MNFTVRGSTQTPCAAPCDTRDGGEGEWSGTHHKGAFHVFGIFAEYVEPLQFGLQERYSHLYTYINML